MTKPANRRVRMISYRYRSIMTDSLSYHRGDDIMTSDRPQRIGEGSLKSLCRRYAIPRPTHRLFRRASIRISTSIRPSIDMRRSHSIVRWLPEIVMRHVSESASNVSLVVSDLFIVVQLTPAMDRRSGNTNEFVSRSKSIFNGEGRGWDSNWQQARTNDHPRYRDHQMLRRV